MRHRFFHDQNNVVGAVQPQTHSYKYDIFGRVIERTNLDAAPIIQQYRYDELGQLTEVLEDQAPTETRHYNALGQLIAVHPEAVDANNNRAQPRQIVFNYNFQGQLVDGIENYAEVDLQEEMHQMTP